MTITKCGWLLIALTICAPATAAEVYRWTDDEGVVHFSDDARAGAEKIEVEEAPAIESVPTERNEAAYSKDESSSQTDATDANQSSDSEYEDFAFVSPEPEATVRGNPGNVTARLSVEPSLREGDGVMVRLDGEPVVDGPTRRLTVELRNLPRGSHTLTAEIVNEDKDTLAKAKPVIFHMHRPSVNLPSNPQ